MTIRSLVLGCMLAAIAAGATANDRDDDRDRDDGRHGHSREPIKAAPNTWPPMCSS